MSTPETQSSSLFCQYEIPNKENNPSKIVQCSNEAHALCKCTQPGLLICREHLMDHMEKASEFPHKPEFFYVSIDSKDTQYITNVIASAKAKLQSDYQKILKASNEIIQEFSAKVQSHLNKVTTIQSAYISALETILLKEKFNRDLQIPILQELQIDFQQFKKNISNTSWFSVIVDKNQVLNGINDFLRIELVDKEVYKLTGLPDGLYETLKLKDEYGTIVDFEELDTQSDSDPEGVQPNYYDSVDYGDYSSQLRDYYDESEEESYEDPYQNPYDPWDNYDEEYDEDEDLYVGAGYQRSEYISDESEY